MSFWKLEWARESEKPSDTAQVVRYELASSRDEGGSAGARDIARAVAEALGKLIAVLEDKNILTPAEIKDIAGLHCYEQIVQKVDA